MASFATQKSHLWVVQETDVCSRCPAACCSCSPGTVQPSSNSSTGAQWRMLDLCNGTKCWSALWDGNTSDPMFFRRHCLYSSRIIDFLAMCNKYKAAWKNLTHWGLPKCQKCSVLILDIGPYSMPKQAVRVCFGFQYQGTKFSPWGKWAHTADVSAPPSQSIALCNLYATQYSSRFGPSCQFLFAK